ncbi:APC family permease [Maridesulfovibrio sp. FT414]|uniref:APC family permease n=1 Tax=Maridesulfovibrio sp. FT414 TaxID=2979469 RepID=UPI003D8077DC
MENKKMGPLQLSGLLAGAVLGSGIILLPPLIHSRIGDWSVCAWVAIMALGAVFAGLFAKLALKYPGSEGVPIAVRDAFGTKAGQLASNCLICAVCAGPVAVQITAADSIVHALRLSPDTAPAISAVIVVFCGLLLLRKITAVGSIALASSIAIGTVLLAGSVTSLIKVPVSPLPNSQFLLPDMGRTLLLMFWAIIGWEVIGNYSMEVRSPKRTIPQATVIGVVTVSVVYILTGWALHSSTSQAGKSAPLSVAQVVEPLLGSCSALVIMIITCALCICTYLMVVGGVSRLVATLAHEGKLLRPLAVKNKNEAPLGGLLAFLGIHITDLLLVHFKVISLEQLIAVANVFFLANSLIAIMAAMKIFKGAGIRIPCMILCMGFCTLLAFSSAVPLCLLAMVSAATIMRNNRNQAEAQQKV